MKPLFKELLEYNYQINQKLIEQKVTQGAKMSEKSLKLLNHIINSHAIWNNRIDAKYRACGVWDIHTAEELLKMNEDNYHASLSILERKYLLKVVDYTTTRGENFTSLVKEIIFHIINHATYHRGQIAADLRQSGIDPLTTDYIFYNRTKI